MTVDMTAFQELKEAVSSRSKEGLLEYVTTHEGGVDGLLEQIFGNLPNAFRPDRAKDQQADFQYEIKAPDGNVREYFVRVRDGVCESGQGRVEAPRVTMTVDVLDFLRLVTGKLNGMQAFLTGKVKLSGDMFYATKFETWFERP